MLGFVRNVRAEVTPDDAVPCRIIFLVEFLLDISSNILTKKVYMIMRNREVARESFKIN